MTDELVLGTAKIGDLLLDNRITNIGGDGAREGVFLRIPDYQRPYKWSAKNANQLLDDIYDAMMSKKDIYRVGTLILHKEVKDGKEVFNIVDGQQRTITFSLLLKCFEGVGEIRFLQQKVTNSEVNTQNIINNYRALKRRISGIRKDKEDNNAKQEYEDLLEYIRKNCELIVVITDGISEAFQFFDSQNARGKALYPHDLLKAYHLRELGELEESEIKEIVRLWEELDQQALSSLFKDYLYRVREWIKGNKAIDLNEQNIDLFKGVSSRDNHPYAQYFKGAYAYADDMNKSKIPFVTGLKLLSSFQLNAPIIAGKPFFEYTRHYFNILADIRNNDKYEGYFINDNAIVRTLDENYSSLVGDRITRLMFDTSILLYVDRFCPGVPSKTDLDYLDQFTIYAFVWAYSLRAQYINLGWQAAQNYIMGISGENKDIINSFNIYKTINNADSPRGLLSTLSDNVHPLKRNRVRHKKAGLNGTNERLTEATYMYFFDKYDFLED